MAIEFPSAIGVDRSRVPPLPSTDCGERRTILAIGGEQPEEVLRGERFVAGNSISPR